MRNRYLPLTNQIAALVLLQFCNTVLLAAGAITCGPGGPCSPGSPGLPCNVTKRRMKRKKADEALILWVYRASVSTGRSSFSMHARITLYMYMYMYSTQGQHKSMMINLWSLDIRVGLEHHLLLSDLDHQLLPVRREILTLLPHRHWQGSVTILYHFRRHMQDYSSEVCLHTCGPTGPNLPVLPGSPSWPLSPLGPANPRSPTFPGDPCRVKNDTIILILRRQDCFQYRIVNHDPFSSELPVSYSNTGKVSGCVRGEGGWGDDWFTGYVCVRCRWLDLFV